MSNAAGVMRPSSSSNGCRHQTAIAPTSARADERRAPRGATSSRGASAAGVSALRPREPERPVLELAREERRADEQRERRQEDQPAADLRERRELAAEMVDDAGRSRSARPAAGTTRAPARWYASRTGSALTTAAIARAMNNARPSQL